MPEDEEETETYRNPHVGFVAYVPTGSLAKGKDLVTTGGARTIGTEFIPGKNTPCITCHREDLMGAVDSPPIIGRSPPKSSACVTTTRFSMRMPKAPVL